METYDNIPEEFIHLRDKIPQKFCVGSSCNNSHCDGTIKLLDRGYDLPDKMNLSDINKEGKEEGGRFCIVCSNHNSPQKCNFKMNISNYFF